MPGSSFVHDSINIVVRGTFNPPIISPAWLLSQELISFEDYSQTETELITSDISILSGPFFDVNVTREGLQLATSDVSAFESVRDLGIGLLKTLEHTPVSVLGINRSVHILIEDIEDYYRLGDLLAPKNYWESNLKFAGLQTLQIQGARTDTNVSGRVAVTVQPSTMVTPGIFVLHNDHFSLDGDQSFDSREDFRPDPTEVKPEPHKTAIAVDVLSNQFNASIARSTSMIESVLAVSHG